MLNLDELTEGIRDNGVFENTPFHGRLVDVGRKQIGVAIRGPQF